MAQGAIRLNNGDARDELMRQVGIPGGLSGRVSIGPEYPSPNVLAIKESLKTGKLAKLVTLAGEIEAGEATSSAEETEEVYEGFVILMGHVLDLVDMCERREGGLAHMGIEVGRG